MKGRFPKSPLTWKEQETEHKRSDAIKHAQGYRKQQQEFYLNDWRYCSYEAFLNFFRQWYPEHTDPQARKS